MCILSSTNMRNLFFIVVTTILLAACAGGGKERAALDAAQAVINDRPDSALGILDSLEPSSQDFSRANLRRWQLLRLMAQNKCDTVFRSDSLQLVLTDYYDRHGTPNEQMWAHYLLGRAYYDMGEVPMALECYLQAVEKADTTSKCCDYNTLTAVYGQMADLFHMQYLPDNEMYALMKSEHCALRDNDTLAAIKAYELRIRPYVLRNDMDSMMLVMAEAQKRYLEQGDRQRAARAVYPAISIHLDRKQYEESKKILDLYERESGNFDEKGELIKGGFYYYDKGRYMLAMGQRDSALSYFRKLEKIGMDEAAYKGLLLTYRELHYADSVAKYALLFAAANDSSFLHVNQENIQRITAMYKYNRQRQLALQKEQKADRWRNGFIIIILSLILVTFVFIYIYKEFKLKKQREIDDLEKNIEVKSKDNVRLNNKNARLHRSHSEQTGKLNLKIEILEKQLSEKNQENKNTIDLEERTNNKHVIHHFIVSFQEYSKDYLPPQEEDWNRVSIAIQILHPNFYHFITSSCGINSEHARICMMVIMDFPERMMAEALNTDGKHIDRKKRQINKKLFSEDKASSLKNNLLRLLGPLPM